jgi:hypothetical protein
MKKYLLIVGSLSVFAASDVQAQSGGLASPVCTVPAGANQAQLAAQDACQQAYDVFQFMGPQLGVLVAGGNATLGQGSTLGGLGHFSVGVRGNFLLGNVPQVNQFTQRTTGATPAVTLPTTRHVYGLPAADVAIGVFGGLPLALTNVGGVDLLVSGSYIPSYTSSNITVTPSQNLQLGYGARIGLLSESILVPGVAFTYLKRDLPTTTITGTSTYTSLTTGATTATLTVSNASVKTTGWRLVASKSLILFGLAAGVGQDKYNLGADLNGTVSGTLIPTTSTSANLAQSVTRTNYFLDASLNFLVGKLTAEVGQSAGGTINTYNSFQAGRADQSYTYFSAGLRLGL